MATFAASASTRKARPANVIINMCTFSRICYLRMKPMPLSGSWFDSIWRNRWMCPIVILPPTMLTMSDRSHGFDFQLILLQPCLAISDGRRFNWCQNMFGGNENKNPEVCIANYVAFTLSSVKILLNAHGTSWRGSFNRKNKKQTLPSSHHMFSSPQKYSSVCRLLALLWQLYEASILRDLFNENIVLFYCQIYCLKPD